MAQIARHNDPQAINQSSDDQFDTRNYLKKDDYNADIDAIKVRLNTLEERVKNRSALAASFSDAFKNDRNMDAALIQVLKKHIVCDEDVKKEIRKVIDEIDRDWLKMFIKRIGFAIGTIVLSLISGAIGYIIHR